jgi:hypothetical protein
MIIVSYSKKNWLGIAGLVIGVIGIALSFHFYNKTLSNREPVFLVDPNRTTIVSKSRIEDMPLRITRLDGSPILDDVTSVTCYFWNNGKKTIRSSDILENISFTLGGDDSEILDYKIIKLSREVIKPILNRSGDHPNSKLSFDFNILEYGDGLSFQIIFAGSPNSSVIETGTIEGVKDIITNAGLVDKQFWNRYSKKLLSYSLVLLFIFSIGGLMAFIEFIYKKYGTKNTKLSKITILALKYLSIITFVTFGGYLLIVTPVINSKREAVASIAELVPPQITGE